MVKLSSVACILMLSLGLFLAMLSNSPAQAASSSLAYSWGDNNLGALGDGSTTNRNSPVAVSVVGGKTFRVEPLKELGDREGWNLDSSLKSDPTKYSLSKDGSGQEHQGPRLDLLLALEVLLRCALNPFEGQKEIPSWVSRSRKVYPQVEKALKDEPPLKAKNNSGNSGY